MGAWYWIGVVLGIGVALGVVATAAWDNVLELVFSDAVHRHYAQPEVVLGRFKN